MALVKKSDGRFNNPILPAFGIVSALSAEDRELLSSYGQFFPVQAGEHFILEGDEQDSLYYVISGMLLVYVDRGGEAIKVGRVGAGESLGEVNLFDPAQASANVVAQDFSQVWRCNRADLESFLSTYHEAGCRLMIGMMTNMSQRLRQMNETFHGDPDPTPTA